MNNNNERKPSTIEDKQMNIYRDVRCGTPLLLFIVTTIIQKAAATAPTAGADRNVFYLFRCH